MSFRGKLVLLLLPIAVLGWLAATPPSELRPVRDGTAEEYWQLAHRLDPPKDHLGSGASSFMPDAVGGYCYYSAGGMHGSSYYRVPEAEVEARWPEVVRRLGVADPKSWQAEGYRHWQVLDPNRKRWSDLARSLQATFLKDMANRSLFSFSLRTVDALEWGILLTRVSQYPMVQFGEWLYLSGLVVFAAWPWLWNGGRWRWAVHVALLPWLLMLPYYLGYCSWTFTSAGPGGGAVYPMLLQLARDVPWYNADTFLVRQLPKPLGSLTGPLGSMMSLSGRSGCGPLAMGVIGLGLGAVAFAARTVILRGERNRATTASPPPAA